MKSKSKSSLLIKVGAIILLLAVAGVMMVIGRGHTIILENKDLEYEGKTYESPYKVTAYVDGEQVAKLYGSQRGERGQSPCIGQKFTCDLEIMAEKGGDEVMQTFTFDIPYNMDGVVINLAGLLAELPEEAYFDEFVPMVVEEEEGDTSAEEIPGGGDEFGMGEI